MAYELSRAPATPMPANVPVHASANYWRRLQQYNASRGRLGCPCQYTAQLSGGRRLGQDDGEVDLGIDTSGGLLGSQLATMEPTESPSYVYSTGDLLGLTGPTGTVTSFTPSNVGTSAPVETVTSSTVPGTTLSASELANLAATGVNTAANVLAATQTPTVAVSTNSLLPAISNTALLIGGGILLMVLASAGSKRR